MNIALSSIPKSKAGLCPHGLPHGACPICSGMGGGGGASTKKANPNEMSWDECVAMGQILKNQRLAQQQRREQALQPQVPLNIAFEGKFAIFAQKIGSLISKISEFSQKLQSTMPAIIAKPVAVLLNKVLVPMLNVLKNIATTIQQNLAQIAQKLADISDKLTAIYGELKSSIEKKISDKFNNLKKKVKSFFGVFDVNGLYDEENKMEEDKRIFELKTLLNSISEKLKQKKDKINEQN